MGFQYYYCNFPSMQYNPNYLKEVIEAIKNKKPYSWIRIGDGEIVFLQQEYVRSIDQIRKSVGWSSANNYCGASIPNLELRDRLIEAIKNSNLVGVFQGDPDTMNCFKVINISPRNIFYAFDNVFLPMNATFVNHVILKNRIYLVGSKSKYYAQKFKEILGIDVVGVSTISDYSEINKVMHEMSEVEFDVALVSAGVNAKIICYEMSKKDNRVYLDMGHAWDNAFHPPPYYQEYWLLPAYQDKYYQPNERVIFKDGLYQNSSNELLNSVPTEDERWILTEKL